MIFNSGQALEYHNLRIYLAGDGRKVLWDIIVQSFCNPSLANETSFAVLRGALTITIIVTNHDLTSRTADSKHIECFGFTPYRCQI